MDAFATEAGRFKLRHVKRSNINSAIRLVGIGEDHARCDNVPRGRKSKAQECANLDRLIS
jgi:hypothetical protein